MGQLVSRHLKGTFADLDNMPTKSPIWFKTRVYTILSDINILKDLIVQLNIQRWQMGAPHTTTYAPITLTG